MRISPDLCSTREVRKAKLKLPGVDLRLYPMIFTPIVGCITTALLAGTALAKTTESRLVVISAAQTTPMLRRLQQEVEALGFSVQIENQGFTDPEVELSKRRAIAAVEVVATVPGFIVLYVLEPRTARIIRQELPIEAPNDPSATDLVTTRAVELLRAARLEVGDAPTRPSAASALAAVPIAPTTRHQELRPQPTASAQLVLGAGPGISYVPQWHPSSDFRITIAYISHWGIGWAGELIGPMTPARVQIPEVGAIEAYATTFRVGGLFQAWREPPLGLRLSSGLEWSQLRFAGRVSSPYAGTSVYLSTFAPWIAVGANIRFSSQFQLVTYLSGSWAMPRTVVRFAGQELRDWGRPALSGTATLEWRPL